MDLIHRYRSDSCSPAVDQAPVVTASNTTLTQDQTVAASSLFTAVDPNGNPITTYALKDGTGNGHFLVNGVVQATNAEIDLTAAQLAQTTYQAGSGSDQISIRAFDGTLWSPWTSSTVAVPVVDQSPVVTAPSGTTTPKEAGSPTLTPSGSTQEINHTPAGSQPTSGIEPSFLAASFGSNAMTVGGDQPLVTVSDNAQNTVIALLNQYTAAGFQAGHEAGALVSPAAPPPSMCDSTVISLPNQKS